MFYQPSKVGMNKLGTTGGRDYRTITFKVCRAATDQDPVCIETETAVPGRDERQPANMVPFLLVLGLVRWEVLLLEIAGE